MPAKLLQLLRVSMLACIVMLCGCRATGPNKVWEAEELLRQGENAEALALLQEAVQMTPRSAPAWNYLGIALQRTGDYPKAIQAYTYALTLDQNLAAAKLNLGIAHLEAGNYSPAAEALVTYTSLRPHDTNGLLRLAQAYLGQSRSVPPNDRNRFYSAVERALDRSGTSAEVLNMQGVLASYRGRAREAYTNYVNALQRAPEYHAARLNLAVLHQGAFRDPAGALAIYKQLYTAKPPGIDTFSLQRAIATLELEVSSRFAPPPPAVVITQKPPAVVVTNLVKTDAPPKVIAAANPAPVVTNQPAKKVPPPTNTVKTPPPVVAEKPPEKPAVKEQPKAAVEPEIVAPPEEVVVAATDPIKAVEPEPLPKVEPAPVVASKPPEETPPAIATNRVPIVVEKPTLLSKLNPANWFDREPGPKPPAVAGREVEEVKRTEPTPLPAAPNYPKYRYSANFLLKDGDRSEARPHFLVGLAAHTDRKYAAAMEAYQRAIAADPRYFEAHHNLALALMQAGDLPGALAGFEKALSLDPVSVEARYNFATALEATDYVHDAARELERAIAADPRSVKAHLFLARINADRLRNIPKAKEHYRKVLELDPRHPKAVDIRYWLAANP